VCALTQSSINGRPSRPCTVCRVCRACSNASTASRQLCSRRERRARAWSRSRRYRPSARRSRRTPRSLGEVGLPDAVASDRRDHERGSSGLRELAALALVAGRLQQPAGLGTHQALIRRRLFQHPQGKPMRATGSAVRVTGVVLWRPRSKDPRAVVEQPAPLFRSRRSTQRAGSASAARRPALAVRARSTGLIAQPRPRSDACALDSA
jgi:hypothetical protein